MHILPLSKRGLNNSLRLDRPPAIKKNIQKRLTNFSVDFFPGNFNSLEEQLHLVSSLIPPHGVHLGDATPQGSGDISEFLFMNFVDPVVVGIDVDHKVLVDLVPDVLDYFGGEDGLEGQFWEIVLDDGVDDIGDDLREVKVDKSGRGEADVVIGVSRLELNLVVVQQFGGFVLAPDVH